MREYKYIFQESRDWENLVSACVPLMNHEDFPAYQILSILVSLLHDPMSISDGTLTAQLLSYVEPGEHQNKIMNCAVTLYVNMVSELDAMGLTHAKSYYLIDAKLHVLIGMYFLS